MGEGCKLPNTRQRCHGPSPIFATDPQLLLSRKSQGHAHAQGFVCACSEHGVADDTSSWSRVAVALVAARCLQAGGALELHGFNWARQRQRQRQLQLDHMGRVERLVLEGMQARASRCISLLI